MPGGGQWDQQSSHDFASALQQLVGGGRYQEAMPVCQRASEAVSCLMTLFCRVLNCRCMALSAYVQDDIVGLASHRASLLFMCSQLGRYALIEIKLNVNSACCRRRHGAAVRQQGPGGRLQGARPARQLRPAGAPAAAAAVVASRPCPCPPVAAVFCLGEAQPPAIDTVIWQDERAAAVLGDGN